MTCLYEAFLGYFDAEGNRRKEAEETLGLHGGSFPEPIYVGGMGARASSSGCYIGVPLCRRPRAKG